MALVVVAGGTAAAVVYAAQRTEGFFQTGAVRLTSPTYAITPDDIGLESKPGGADWLIDRGTVGWWEPSDARCPGEMPGLIGVLVLIAAVALRFTGRYPRSIFDLVLGLNRWVDRVVADATILTERDPPLRLVRHLQRQPSVADCRNPALSGGRWAGYGSGRNPRAYVLSGNSWSASASSDIVPGTATRGGLLPATRRADRRR